MFVDRPGNSRSGKAWRLSGSVVAVGLLGLGTLRVVEQLGHEQETIVSEIDGSRLRTVDVRTDAGSIHIVGGDDDTVRMTARVDHGLRDTEHSQRVEGDRLVVRGDCPAFLSQFCNVDYDIEVPRDVAVVVHTGNDRATVRDVTGDVAASTGNGRVELVGATGDVQLRSGNGRVVGSGLSSERVEARTGNGSVDLTFVDSPRTVYARSGNGSVEIVLPDEDIAYLVDESSGNGAVDTQIRTDPTSDRTITARTGNGNVTIRYPSG
jgi:hypothetical protein